MLIESPIIYFFDQEKENVRTAKKVLTSLTPDAHFPKESSEIPDILKDNEVELLIIDFEMHQKLLSDGADLSAIKHILFISSEKMSSIYSNLKSVPQFSHFIAKDKDGELTGTDLFTTVRKILTKNIFGIERYLVGGGQIESYTIKSSNDVPSLIEENGAMAKRMGLRKPICNAIKNLVDEFCMNAVFDAPLDSEGNRRYFQVQRHEEVNLEKHEYATLRVGTDGETLAISISDPFGNISRKKILDYLSRCFENQSQMVRDNADMPGGGVGLFVCFNMVQKFIINVDPTNQTEFIGIFDLSQSVEEWMRTNKSFHFFSTDPESKIFNKD